MTAGTRGTKPKRKPKIKLSKTEYRRMEYRNFEPKSKTPLNVINGVGVPAAIDNLQDM